MKSCQLDYLESIVVVALSSILVLLSTKTASEPWPLNTIYNGSYYFGTLNWSICSNFSRTFYEYKCPNNRSISQDIRNFLINKCPDWDILCLLKCPSTNNYLPIIFSKTFQYYKIYYYFGFHLFLLYIFTISSWEPWSLLNWISIHGYF